MKAIPSISFNRYCFSSIQSLNISKYKQLENKIMRNDYSCLSVYLWRSEAYLTELEEATGAVGSDSETLQ